MTMDAHKQDWLEKTTDFAVANGKDGCFTGWPREYVRQYIAFHHIQSTLALVRNENDIVAVGTATQCDPDAQIGAWDWTPTDPRGRYLVILDVIATHRRAIALLFKQMFTLWPPGSVDKIFALRPRGLVEVTPRYINLLANS